MWIEINETLMLQFYKGCVVFWYSISESQVSVFFLSQKKKKSFCVFFYFVIHLGTDLILHEKIIKVKVVRV